MRGGLGLTQQPSLSLSRSLLCSESQAFGKNYALIMSVSPSASTKRVWVAFADILTASVSYLRHLKPSNLHSFNRVCIYSFLDVGFWHVLVFFLFGFACFKEKQSFLYCNAGCHPFLSYGVLGSTVLDQHKLVSPSPSVMPPFPTLHLLT